MGNNYVNIENSRFSGNLVQGEIKGNIEAHINHDSDMSNTGDTYNIGQAGAVGQNARSDGNIFNQSDQAKTLSNQTETLSEAVSKIQKLLKQLEESNSSATNAEKINYVNDETTPSFKRRVIGALKLGGEAAIEEFVDNSYISVVKSILKGWLNPE